MFWEHTCTGLRAVTSAVGVLHLQLLHRIKASVIETCVVTLHRVLVRCLRSEHTTGRTLEQKQAHMEVLMDGIGKGGGEGEIGQGRRTDTYIIHPNTYSHFVIWLWFVN